MTDHSQATAGCILFDLKKQDAVSVGGQIIHPGPGPLRDYLEASEWADPENMVILEVLMHPEVEIKPSVKPEEVNMPEMPEDL